MRRAGDGRGAQAQSPPPGASRLPRRRPRRARSAPAPLRRGRDIAVPARPATCACKVSASRRAEREIAGGEEQIAAAKQVGRQDRAFDDDAFARRAPRPPSGRLRRRDRLRSPRPRWALARTMWPTKYSSGLASTIGFSERCTGSIAPGERLRLDVQPAESKAAKRDRVRVEVFLGDGERRLRKLARLAPFAAIDAARATPSACRAHRSRDRRRSAPGSAPGGRRRNRRRSRTRSAPASSPTNVGASARSGPGNRRSRRSRAGRRRRIRRATAAA